MKFIPLIIGLILIIIPKKTFEVEGIGYIKPMHIGLKIIGVIFCIIATINIFVLR